MKNYKAINMYSEEFNKNNLVKLNNDYYYCEINVLNDIYMIFVRKSLNFTNNEIEKRCNWDIYFYIINNECYTVFYTNKKGVESLIKEESKPNLFNYDVV